MGNRIRLVSLTFDSLNHIVILAFFLDHMYDIFKETIPFESNKNIIQINKYLTFRPLIKLK